MRDKSRGYALLTTLHLSITLDTNCALVYNEQAPAKIQTAISCAIAWSILLRSILAQWKGRIVA
jgi:uncharacterized membrane protein